MKPFLSYAGRFSTRFFISFYTLLSAISTVLTFFPMPTTLHKLLPYATLVGFILSAYRAGWLLHKEDEAKWEDSRESLKKQVGDLQANLATAHIRPYDSDHRQLTERKLSGMTVRERDLLRFLLHRGRTETTDVRAAWSGPALDTDQLLNVLKASGFVNMENQQTQNAARILAFWQINANYVDVLSDLLYPRVENDPGQFKF